MNKNKCLLSVLLLLFISANNLFAQEKPIAKGQSILDIYYGIPNFYPVIIKQGYNNNYDLTRGITPDYKTTNFNPIGLKYERLIRDNIGVGLNIFYANSIIEWSDASYNYTSSVARFRVAVTYNYHFASTAKFDPYFIAHLGYAYINYEFEQVPTVNVIPVIHPIPDIKFDFPVTIRAGIGFRYYFSKNFGMNFEAGIGGVLLTGGLSCKF